MDTRLGKAPRLAPADRFIMTPPFSRDSRFYAQFTEREETAIKAQEAALPGKTAVHRSGGSNGAAVPTDNAGIRVNVP